MRPLAVIGNLTRDTVDAGPPRIGGAPFHAGRALRLLGRPAVIVTKCAGDDRSLLLPQLVALGIPVVAGTSSATSEFRIRYDADRRWMGVEVVGEPWSAEEAAGWVADGLGRSEWVHVAPVLRTDFPPETLAELARGRRLSLDGQGLVRPGRTGELRLDADFDPALLDHVQVLKLSEDEAEMAAGGFDLERLTRLGVPEVIVTRASVGSLVLTDGRLHEVAAHPIAALDPTGAGDAFAAGYLAARSDGDAPPAAARRATALVAELLERPRR